VPGAATIDQTRPDARLEPWVLGPTGQRPHLAAVDSDPENVKKEGRHEMKSAQDPMSESEGIALGLAEEGRSHMLHRQTETVIRPDPVAPPKAQSGKKK
jgi:hypothetical protein